jgi:hypothetical protein
MTRGRSASHHLQVKAALALRYNILGTTNPFAQCAAPKFAPEKIALRYDTASQLGQLLRELREDRRSFLDTLRSTSPLLCFSQVADFTSGRSSQWRGSCANPRAGC